MSGASTEYASKRVETMTMTMTEPTIGEIVEIQSGYTSYVDLRLELFDDSRNIGRMSRYRPILSHRQAFQKRNRSEGARCYAATGKGTVSVVG